MARSKGNNRRLTDFSLAPMYLFKISGPLTLMKLSPHSFATAEASMVFPHPGYPYNSSLWKVLAWLQPVRFNSPRTEAQWGLGENASVFCWPFQRLPEDPLRFSQPWIHRVSRSGWISTQSLWKQTSDISPTDRRFLQVYIPKGERDKILLSSGEVSIRQFRLW